MFEILPKLAVIDSISFGFLLRGRPFCRGGWGRPGTPWGVELKNPADPTFILISLGLDGPFGDEPYWLYWQDSVSGVGVVDVDSKLIS